MGFDKKALVLPDDTRFEEHTIVTTGDLILGNHVQCGFGLKTDGRLFTGQGVHVEGDIACDEDLRLDQSTHVMGDIECGANVYLGERCFIKGDLALEGDLDVGDDVKISGQLKAKGWVNKRSPVPLLIYIFIYLLELMRLGQSDEVERILTEMDEGDEDIAVGEVYLFIPDGSEVGLQSTTIKGSLETGTGCRILGNLTIKGDAVLGEGTRIHGALRVEGKVTLEPDSQVEGDLEAQGAVVVSEGCQVLGDLKAESVEMFTSATVDGKILADGGVTFRTEAQERRRKAAEGKAEEFESKSADLVDLLG